MEYIICFALLVTNCVSHKEVTALFTHNKAAIIK